METNKEMQKEKDKKTGCMFLTVVFLVILVFSVWIGMCDDKKQAESTQKPEVALIEFLEAKELKDFHFEILRFSDDYCQVMVTIPEDHFRVADNIGLGLCSQMVKWLVDKKYNVSKTVIDCTILSKQNPDNPVMYGRAYYNPVDGTVIWQKWENE
ncbi:hypothetical protein AGMMS49525_18210 [Bacteroidia bacterium]|nr:hypothetical protein AGMMS49525_18210 [Bacteroidia bacterium]